MMMMMMIILMLHITHQFEPLPLYSRTYTLNCTAL
jgi:hypothetical protein